MACTQVSFGQCELFKWSIGGRWGWDENKNKFEKLKANRSQSKEEVCSQVQTKEFAWGVCNDDMGQYRWEILKQFLRLLFLLREGLGARGEGGCQIQSVINEHFKRPNCGR